MANPVVETVTFELAEHVTDDMFLTQIRRTEDFVRSYPGFIFRRLSSGADGRWTDTVVWQDMATAQAAGKAFEAQPFLPELLATMNTSSIQMRHETVRWMMEPA